MTMTFDDLLTHHRQKSVSTRNQGDHLEALAQQYLLKDGVHSLQFEKVWLWKDWPERNNFSDLGIDLVAQRFDGGLTAIQCKFYDKDHTMVKTDIDSFLSASSRKPFTQRMVVATTDKWSKPAEAMLENQHIPVQRIGLNDFRNSNINWDTYRFDAPEESLETFEKSNSAHTSTMLLRTPSRVLKLMTVANSSWLVEPVKLSRHFVWLKSSLKRTVMHAYSLWFLRWR